MRKPGPDTYKRCQSLTPGGRSTPNALAADRCIGQSSLTPSRYRSRKRPTGRFAYFRCPGSSVRVSEQPTRRWRGQRCRSNSFWSEASYTSVPFAGHHLQLLVCRNLHGGEPHPNLKCPIFSLGCGSSLPQRSIPLLESSFPVLEDIAICYINYNIPQYPCQGLNNL